MKQTADNDILSYEQIERKKGDIVCRGNFETKQNGMVQNWVEEFMHVLKYSLIHSNRQVRKFEHV